MSSGFYLRCVLVLLPVIGQVVLLTGCGNDNAERKTKQSESDDKNVGENTKGKNSVQADSPNAESEKDSTYTKNYEETDGKNESLISQKRALMNQIVDAVSDLKSDEEPAPDTIDEEDDAKQEKVGNFDPGNLIGALGGLDPAALKDLIKGAADPAAIKDAIAGAAPAKAKDILAGLDPAAIIDLLQNFDVAALKDLLAQVQQP